MATNKSTKKPAAPTKATSTKTKTGKGSSKATKTTAGKKKLKTAASGNKRKTVRQVKKVREKEPVASLIHGPDMHLIPVTGEIHPVRRDEAGAMEKVFKHNEEIALHREQQRVKQILSKGGGRRIFKNPRQS
jgi:hypothetical protein